MTVPGIGNVRKGGVIGQDLEGEDVIGQDPKRGGVTGQGLKRERELPEKRETGHMTSVSLPSGIVVHPMIKRTSFMNTRRRVSRFKHMRGDLNREVVS